jgi:hypothetical protein
MNELHVTVSAVGRHFEERIGIDEFGPKREAGDPRHRGRSDERPTQAALATEEMMHLDR